MFKSGPVSTSHGISMHFLGSLNLFLDICKVFTYAEIENRSRDVSRKGVTVRVRLSVNSNYEDRVA